jgi:malyl-CoA/(S)-citramalyl-CoA lyase
MPLRRSLLAVPGGRAKFLARSASNPADAVFLDLEDAVLPGEKAGARQSVVVALNEIDWGRKTILVRINDLGSPWAAQDIAFVVGSCERLDGVLIPKVSRPEEVRLAASLVMEAEERRGSDKRVAIELLIENPLAVINAEALLVASDRVSGAVFGAGDYSLSMGNYDLLTGLTRERSGAGNFAESFDPWTYARSKLANACRAFGRTSVDGIFTNIADLEGFRGFAERARMVGYDGVLAIHPSQVPIANEVFTPREDEIVWARMVLSAMNAPDNAGRGAIRLNNMLVDVAHVRLAEKILAKADLLSQG